MKKAAGHRGELWMMERPGIPMWTDRSATVGAAPRPWPACHSLALQEPLV